MFAYKVLFVIGWNSVKNYMFIHPNKVPLMIY